MGEEMMMRVRRSAATIFSFGVRISAILIVIGMAMTFVTGDTSNPYGTQEWDNMLNGNLVIMPSQVLLLGFTVLIATSILNIASAVYIFFRGNDDSLAIITTVVLLVLLVGLTINMG
ncbi:MAG: DUF1634 domain-containing protein [Candidatus Bathyarchaeota archaeon]|jgi:uncharacterized membrane protein|nr:DUF1634 domain-containing protein [Candidatus Bathyarchaeota archaeon]MDP7206989.1 DUF1634 domain-containing protein [Candidatus Bathyarchaeota archaeon]MDP7442786.1 DUF1634 domain-containing protein [Candidatus Bathyarchaeota archaeon]